MSLREEAVKRMKQARGELRGDAIWHLLNCPAMQVGYMDKAVAQQFNH
jgi:hypothetical protein